MEELNKKILIVEDEPAMLEILVEKFSKEGFEVVSAKDGVEGLEVALKEHPDLILLDILLPKMNGMEMLEKLRKDNWGKEASVIILTNLSAEEKISEALEKGVYYFLVKTDWSLGDLAKEIKKKLGVIYQNNMATT